MEHQTQSSKEDRVLGVLLGLAAGDKNGGPTQMALRLANSLIQKQDYVWHHVAEQYLAWWQEGAFDTGPVAAAVLKLLDEDTPIEKAVAQVHREMGQKTAGCNPAHRAGPLAMAAFLDSSKLMHYGALEAAITHWDPMAGEVAGSVVVLSRALIEGTPWSQARQESGYGRHFKIERAFQVADFKSLKSDGYAPEVLKAAIYFLEEHDNFASALQASMAFAGPANYCPVLVGAIGGARWGASAITPKLLAHVTQQETLRATAQQLAASWNENT